MSNALEMLTNLGGRIHKINKAMYELVNDGDDDCLCDLEKTWISKAVALDINYRLLLDICGLLSEEDKTGDLGAAKRFIDENYSCNSDNDRKTAIYNELDELTKNFARELEISL